MLSCPLLRSEEDRRLFSCNNTELIRHLDRTPPSLTEDLHVSYTATSCLLDRCWRWLLQSAEVPVGFFQDEGRETMIQVNVHVASPAEFGPYTHLDPVSRFTSGSGGKWATLHTHDFRRLHPSLSPFLLLGCPFIS